LLKGVSTHYSDILLQKVIILIHFSLTLCPFNFKSENAWIFSQDVSPQIPKGQIFGGFDGRLFVFVTDVVATPEELLLFVRN
jgi:hypothetical protein